MKKLPVNIKDGDEICVTFKSAPFSPSPNPRTQMVDYRMNITSGKFRGLVSDDCFRLETTSDDGIHVLWTFNEEDILTIGIRTEGANIARVQ